MRKLKEFSMCNAYGLCTCMHALCGTIQHCLVLSVEFFRRERYLYLELDDPIKSSRDVK